MMLGVLSAASKSWQNRVDAMLDYQYHPNNFALVHCVVPVATQMEASLLSSSPSMTIAAPHTPSRTADSSEYALISPPTVSSSWRWTRAAERRHRDLLCILGNKLQNKGFPQITELPSNLRVLVTSRPLHDIEGAFHGAQHILRLSMDEIPAAVAEHDISIFVSDKLQGLPRFGRQEFAKLAAKADGFFEWARLACEYIKEDLPGVNPMFRFETLVNRDLGKWTNKLYDMYRRILAEIWPRHWYGDVEYQEALVGFRAEMGQILSPAEPLPFDSFNAMRNYFPNQTNITSWTLYNKWDPASAELLTGKSFSGDFFIEATKAQHHDLALASFQVMEHGLRFNLESSYLPNRDDSWSSCRDT
ncbi:uncharacterized protein EDB93DRAFT_1105763 [Suillus bovinus]|uniref:uncharacterized protein n=1 Tax=Suillus bovinus TaxID=48563 RepID=UPI001B87C5EC|nr:uncharacterized protein EDB93DRAFT_1105763 [Suillus bovinus]KAG2141159.1 hypothetical protein EDB93DRAFT_1105763 [Suillus bovinus]